MKTFSQEEFKKIYGESGLAKFSQPTPQKSLKEKAGEFSTGFVKGGLETAIGTAQILQGFGQRVVAGVDPSRNLEQVRKQTGFPSLGGEEAKSQRETLKATSPEERAGKITQFAAEALWPFSRTQEVGTLLSKGKKLAEPIVGKGVEVAGKGLDITKRVTSKTGQYATGRAPKLLGIFSGEGDDVIRQALRNPKMANQGLEAGDEALRRVVAEGSQNSIKIRNAFTQGYRQSKSQVFGQHSGVLIPKTNVVGIFNNLLKENGVKIAQDGSLDFTTSKIIANPGEIKKIQDAYQALRQWDAFTIDSLDEFKQLVGKLTRFADEAGVPSKSPFLGRFYNELNTVFRNKLPKDVYDNYASLNKKFSKGIEMYDDLVDAFNKGDPFTKLAGSLGKNKDTLRQILEFYAKQEGGQDVLPVIAGRELGLEKTAAFGFLNPRSWVDFFISPKTQGKVITTIGQKFPRLGQ